MRKRDLPPEGITRRTFMKGAAAAGTAGFLGVGVYGTIRSLQSPPLSIQGETLDTFLYVRPEGALVPVWYSNLYGEEARLSHFDIDRGANVLWKVVVDSEGQIVPFTGYPGLILRMDDSVLEFPEGYARDDFVLNGLYASFNCCPHACCRPGYQLIPRTRYKIDPGYETIYCPCHDSQYNPRRIVRSNHPLPPDASGAEYLGVFKEPGLGPADRGMPLIPLELEGDRLVGVARDESWYQYLDFKRAKIPE